jgi:hypothetical protein
VFVRDMVWRWVSVIHLDWVLGYVLVSFCASLCVVHFFVGRGGGVLNAAMTDVVQGESLYGF